MRHNIHKREAEFIIKDWKAKMKWRRREPLDKNKHKKTSKKEKKTKPRSKNKSKKQEIIKWKESWDLEDEENIYASICYLDGKATRGNDWDKTRKQKVQR